MPSCIVTSYHHTITPAYDHTITPSHHHTIVPSHQHTIIPSHHHTITPSYRHTLIPPHRHTIIPSCQHTSIPPYHHSIIPSYHRAVMPSQHRTETMRLRVTRAAVRGSLLSSYDRDVDTPVHYFWNLFAGRWSVWGPAECAERLNNLRSRLRENALRPPASA